MVLGRTFGIQLSVAMLLGMVACSRAAAEQTPPTPTPVILTFARITQPEPLQLPEGGSFTLVGYSADAIAIADPQMLRVITPTVAQSEFSAPETTLLATAAGTTQVTITETLCEGVSSCNGPALFFNLKVEVQ
jgi:hypothetical protein